MTAFFGLTVSDYVSIAANVGTFIAALIAVLTLRELRQQRISAAKPVLAISTQTFSWKADGLNEPGSLADCSHGSARWTHRNLDETATEPKEQSTARLDYTLAIYNIAHAAAKNIVVSFSFQLDELVAEINAIAHAKFLRIRVERNPTTGWLDLTAGSGLNMSTNLAMDMQSKHDFSLPMSVDKTGTLVRMPLSFRLLSPCTIMSSFFSLRTFRTTKTACWKWS
jgi:hypothetical protein